MMTSSNGNIFHITGPLCREFTGHRWIHLTKASDAELWCFLWSPPEYTVEQTIVRLVIWDAIAFIMTSLYWFCTEYIPWNMLMVLLWFVTSLAGVDTCGAHDDVIKWKHFPRYWPFVRGIHRSRWIPRTKASDAELWYFLWSASE